METMVSISEHDRRDIDRANASGRQPIIFVHGLWLLSNSWDRWVDVFDAAGFVALAPGWPDDPETVDDANANPDVMADKTIAQVANHFARISNSLSRKPALIGHSFGGLLAQILAGQGHSAATVAIDPAQFRGVLPLPFAALKSAFPILGNPANRHRAVPLTFDQFRYAFANALVENEAKALYDTFAVPAPGAPLFQSALANFNPWTESRVDTENPDQGPMLIMSGEKDHTVPPAVAHAAFKLQSSNPGLTEFVEIKDRGHALTIDHGWREVADTALAFVQRFTGQIASR